MISVVLEEKSKQGFYSRYFVILKKDSTSLRPILDHCVPNKYLHKYNFSMLTHKVLFHNQSTPMIDL